LAVEVDGCSHDVKEQADARRQSELERMGVRVLRFWDQEVKHDMVSVLERIRAWVRENAGPTPSPLARGHPSKEGSPEAPVGPLPGGVPEGRGG
jgi:hypothetical protein